MLSDKKLTIEDFYPFCGITSLNKIQISLTYDLLSISLLVRLLSFLLSSQSISIIVFITMYPCAEENCVETEQLDSAGKGLI